MAEKANAAFPPVHPALLETLKKLADGVDELRHLIAQSDTRQGQTSELNKPTGESSTTCDPSVNQKEEHDETKKASLGGSSRRVSGIIEPSTDILSRNGPSNATSTNTSHTGGSLPQWVQENLARDAPTEEKLLLLKQEITSGRSSLWCMFNEARSWDYDLQRHGEVQSTESVLHDYKLVAERVAAHWPQKLGTLRREAAGGSDQNFEITWTILDKLSEVYGSGINYRNELSDMALWSTERMPTRSRSSCTRKARLSLQEIWTFYPGRGEYMSIDTLALIADRFKWWDDSDDMEFRLEASLDPVANVLSFDSKRNILINYDVGKTGNHTWQLRASSCDFLRRDHLRSVRLQGKESLTTSIWDRDAHYPFGFPLKRHKGRIKSLFGNLNDSDAQPGAEYYFQEQILSNFMKDRHYGSIQDEDNYTRYTIFCWRDGRAFQEIYNLPRDDIGDCGKDGIAYAAFFTCIWANNQEWAYSWTGTLNRVDELIGIQMLRIFLDWTKQTKEYNTSKMLRIRQDLKILALSEKYDLRMDELMKCSQLVERQMDTLVDGIISRIEKNQAEVEGLRDGLFNASSLREAVQSRTLNLFVIVFTVLTIIYTPLGFLAALWAMPNLAAMIDGSGASTPKSFYISWIVLPVGTYVAAAFFLAVAWGSSSPDGKSFILRCKTRLEEIMGLYKEHASRLPGYPKDSRIGKAFYHVFIGVPFFLARIIYDVLVWMLGDVIFQRRKSKQEPNGSLQDSNTRV